MENASFKLCPFCKEQIRKEAVKCRFCGEWLEQQASPPSSQAQAAKTSTIKVASKIKDWRKWLIIGTAACITAVINFFIYPLQPDAHLSILECKSVFTQIGGIFGGALALFMIGGLFAIPFKSKMGAAVGVIVVAVVWGLILLGESQTAKQTKFNAIKIRAERGDADAQCQMADCYFEGHGVAQDFEESARWMRKAAEQGFVGAQFKLGAYYEEGVGVPKSDLDAYVWSSCAIAAIRGTELEDKLLRDKALLHQLEQIKGRLSPTELLEAQRRIDTFVPKKREDSEIMKDKRQ
jgi:hypothetical protein